MDRSEQKIVKSEPKRFSTTEICRIIKVAKKQGVSALQIGELMVSFKEAHVKNSLLDKPVELTAGKHSVVRKTAAEVEREFGVQDKRTLDELRSAQLLIDDPVSYEEAEIDAALHGHEKMVTVNEDERHW